MCWWRCPVPSGTHRTPRLQSITAGVHSSGGNHTYPGQLQIMLDIQYPGKYKVTNLGACGSTMLKVREVLGQALLANICVRSRLPPHLLHRRLRHAPPSRRPPLSSV